jgi:hypothetical protein
MTEKFRGEEVYTHMIFAEKILDLAKRAKVESLTSGLWNVRDELPEILREKVPENQASWTAFAQAIKDVEMGHIREGVRKYKASIAKEAEMKADINLLKQRTVPGVMGVINSPTKAIRTQLASTAISQHPTGQPAQNNPFGGSAVEQATYSTPEQHARQQPRRRKQQSEPPWPSTPANLKPRKAKPHISTNLGPGVRETEKTT